MADNKIRLYTQAMVDLEFQDLPGDGTLNDKIFKYLITLGGEGTLTDMLKQYHDGSLTPSVGDSILLEIGDYLLLENGDKLLLE